MYNKEFELLCRILSTREIDCGDTLGFGSDLENASWEVLLQLADGYHVTSALHVCLKRRGCLRGLDKEVVDFLEGGHELNCLHNQLLKNEALTAIRLLNTKGIDPVLLKGMAGLMTGLYEDDGERLIGDIDLLINIAGLRSALRVFLDHGYHCDDEVCDKVFSSTFHMHELTLITKSGSAKLDLHVRPTGPSGEEAFVSTEGAMAKAEVVELEGARFLLPSPVFRFMHNFYHAQYLDRSYLEASINLRQLIDWVKLWRRYDGEVIVSAMEQKLLLHRQLSSFRLYVLSAERYLDLPMPASIKVGWYERLVFKRQNLLMQYQGLSTINAVFVFFLSGAQLIIPERLRLTHGNLPLWRLIVLRIADLFDPRWYWRRIGDIKRMFSSR